jgi:transcriptional regulator with XRE-family HTH domain
MGTVQRDFDIGTRHADSSLRTLADELRTARLMSGLSQAEVARTARVSRQAYSRIERGADRHLTIVTASRVAAGLRLRLSVRAFPSGPRTRDAAHAKHLASVLSHVGPPLRHRVEVPLPRTEERPEYRAWDAVIWSNGQRTAIELETRLYDVQAQLRAINLKRRDDPPDRFLLVLADTRTNRRVVADYPELFAELPRVRKSRVVAALGFGAHPPSGVMFW